jgi:hypothetical protein
MTALDTAYEQAIRRTFASRWQAVATVSTAERARPAREAYENAHER